MNLIHVNTFGGGGGGRGGGVGGADLIECIFLCTDSLKLGVILSGGGGGGLIICGSL